MDIETVAKVGAIFATGFSVGAGAAYHLASRGVMDSCRAVIADRERSRQPPPAPEASPEPPQPQPEPPRTEPAAPAVTEYRLPTKIGSIATLDGRDVYVLSTYAREERTQGSRFVNVEYSMRGYIVDDTNAKGGN